MGEKLESGSQLPGLQLSLVDGCELRIPDDLATEYAVVLLYRGYW